MSLFLAPAKTVILTSSGTAIPHTGDTSEVALKSVAIPANYMGTNGRIIATGMFSWTNSGNNKTIRHKIGASGTGGSNIGQNVTTVTGAGRYQLELFNSGVTGTQRIYWISTGYGLVALGADASIDTTSQWYFNWTVQLANSGETISLDSYRLEYWPSV